MRSHHIIAVAVVLVVGIGVKVFFFGQTAEANREPPTHATMNVLKMHHDFPNMKNLPVQKARDMTFVFADGD
jgi:hypothetical protein